MKWAIFNSKLLNDQRAIFGKPLISRWAPLSTGASTEALPCLGAERSMEFVEDH